MLKLIIALVFVIIAAIAKKLIDRLTHKSKERRAASNRVLASLFIGSLGTICETAIRMVGTIVSFIL